jgi:hypothetical protein
VLRARLAVAAMWGLIGAGLLASACSGSRPNHRSEAAPAGAHRTGSLVQADALGNTVIGGPYRTTLTFRFRATWTGSVVAVRVYVIRNVNGRTGYSAGNEGRMRVALEADSGRQPHVPVGRALASTTFRPAERGYFPLLRFGTPAKVVAGRLYHVVFSNVDPDPTRNYVSINALYSASRLGRGPAVPDGLAVLIRYDAGGGAAGWSPRGSSPREHYLPILDVVGSRAGEHDGLGYMEVWHPRSIGTGAMVRQLMRTPPDRSTRVDGAWLRLRRHDGAGNSLVLSLDRPDGRALATASVAPREVPTNAAGWVHVRFAKPVSLAPGTDVALTASANGAASYEAFPIRKGTGFGFDPKTYFDRGYAQFNDGDGWVGWDQWGAHDRREGDLQFAIDAGNR